MSIKLYYLLVMYSSFWKKKFFFNFSWSFLLPLQFTLLFNIKSLIFWAFKPSCILLPRKKKKRKKKSRWVKSNVLQRLKFKKLNKKKFTFNAFKIFRMFFLPSKHDMSSLLMLILGYKAFYFSNIIPLKNDALTMFQFLFRNFFFKLFNKIFAFKLINLSNIFSLKLLKNSVTFLKKMTPKRLRFYYFTELSEILLSTAISKNLIFLIKWYRKLIEKKGLKMLNLTKRYLKWIFSRFFRRFQRIINLKGYFLQFKGKFYKGGGKKKKSIYRSGMYSNTHKSLRLLYKKINIRTISGVIGLVIKISY